MGDDLCLWELLSSISLPTCKYRNLYLYTYVVLMRYLSGLGLSNSFIALVVLRGLQAAGSAATISIGNFPIALKYDSFGDVLIV